MPKHIQTKEKQLTIKLKLSEKYPTEMIRNLKLFFISTLISFFPFLTTMVVGAFQYGLQDFINMFYGFFGTRDMLMFIVSFTVSSAVNNLFMKNKRIKWTTNFCWTIVAVCCIYFCMFDEKNVIKLRVLALLIIAFVLSLINIFKTYSSNSEN